MNRNPYIPKPAKLTRVKSLTQNEKIFEVEFLDKSTLEHQPGQFVEVSVAGVGEAPISVASPPSGNGTFELCIRKVGNVTKAIHGLQPGSTIGIRGPFGRGFPLENLKGSNIVFVAGGIGIVPLRSLIKYVLSDRESYKEITILYGGKSQDEILFKDEIDEWSSFDNINVILTIDKPAQGWKGRVGVVTTFFPEIDFDSDNTYAVVVGPPVMYKFVILGLGSRRINGNKIIVSLERKMKCGLGKCGHCQLGSIYVCKDGPVFAYNEIRHMKGVL